MIILLIKIGKDYNLNSFKLNKSKSLGKLIRKDGLFKRRNFSSKYYFIYLIPILRTLNC